MCWNKKTLIITIGILVVSTLLITITYANKDYYQIRTIITHFGLKKADGHAKTVLRFGGIFGILSVKQHSAIKLSLQKKAAFLTRPFLLNTNQKFQFHGIR